MRFIFNFIFFGVLFYLIWMLFPDIFTTLVSWAGHIVLFAKNLVLDLWGKLQPYWPSSNSVPKLQTAPVIFFLQLW